MNRFGFFLAATLLATPSAFAAEWIALPGSDKKVAALNSTGQDALLTLVYWTDSETWEYYLQSENKMEEGERYKVDLVSGEHPTMTFSATGRGYSPGSKSYMAVIDDKDVWRLTEVFLAGDLEFELRIKHTKKLFARAVRFNYVSKNFTDAFRKTGPVDN